MVGPSRRIGALVLLAALAAACQRAPTLLPIGGVEVLQQQFNKDHGQPRVVLLLSPT
jgi:hypothetical protein